MPIGPFTSFQECLDKGNSEAYCGAIKHKVEGSSLTKGATITADLGRDQLFTKGGKRFAKIFLISSATNMKKWEVTDESIPRRIGTFVGRPYISEPGLAHFDTETLPVDQIIQKQEKFRAGTIREVVTGPNSGISYAIVEFANNALGDKAWKEMQKGEAIYSSPAIAGISRLENGVRTFYDWFGLHLARVKDPAYGVFHASIKQTCEGNERACISKMVATASNYMIDKNSSEILLRFTDTQMQTGTAQDEKCPPGPEGEDCRSKQVEQMSASIASINKTLADLQKAVSNIPGSEGKTTPVTDPIGGEKQTTAQDNGNCPEGEHMVDGNCVPNDTPSTANTDCPESEKDADGNCPGTASTASQVKQLQTIVAGYQKKEKEGLVQQYIEMASNAEIITEADASAERDSLLKLDIPTLESKVADMTRVAAKISELQQSSGRMQSTNGKIINMPETASASMSGQPQKPTNLKQVGSWYQ